MPPRRHSVDPDATDERAEPPESLSGTAAGARPAAGGNNGDKATSSFPRTSRGSASAPPRAGARGRGRGRGRVRASALARNSGTNGSGSHAAGTASETANSSSGGSDQDEDDAAEPRAPVGPAPARSKARLPREVSPELGIPDLLTAAAKEHPRSSSLSAVSSRASSPALENSSLAPATPNGAQNTLNGGSSPSSVATARPASPRPREPDQASSAEPGPSTPARKTPSDRNPLDSLSELDSSDDDEARPPRGTNGVGKARRSTSTDSTPAPPGTENSESLSPAPKRRGRPPGSKSRSSGDSAQPKARRSVNSARPGSLASPGRVSSSESVTPAPGGAPARATRANVTLPPGYIWGVTSSRWPRKPKKGEEPEEDGDDDQDHGSDRPPADSEPAQASSLNNEDDPYADAKPIEVDVEEAKPMPPTPPPLAAPPPPPPQEDSPRVSTPRQDALDLQAASILGGMDLEPEPTPVPSMSREASRDGSVDSVAMVSTPRGKGKGKGKRGKKVLPEPIERAKRRRLDGLDKETAERYAAREAARARFLTDLEAEMQLVEEHTHPLLDYTYARLEDEKKQKLEQLRRYQEEREDQLARSLESARRANWANWSDRKDRLRMDLYLNNHSSLRSLLDEEKVFPFFRNHPLFVNHHDLPPTGWYRGPQRDPTFAPRSLVHAGHYVEPPPLNPALSHDSWVLAPDEIEADLALFYDIDEVQVQPAPPPPPPVPTVPFYGMYGYQPPPYIYDSNAPTAAYVPGSTPGPPYPAPPLGAPFGAGPSLGLQAPTGHVASPFGPHVSTGAGGPPPPQHGYGAPPPAATTQPSSLPYHPNPNAQTSASAPRARARTPPKPVKAEPPAPIRQTAPIAHAGGPSAAATPTAQPRSGPPARPQSPARVSVQTGRQPSRHAPPSSAHAGSSSAPASALPQGTFSSFVGRQPQAPTISQPPSQPTRTQTALAAPVWPTYSASAGPSRPPNPPAGRTSSPYAPTAAPAPTSAQISYPPAAARVPAPPVMPGPPLGSSGGNKPWPPPSSRSPNTASSLPPIRQTLFPTAFPTGGLPPIVKSAPQPAPSTATDRSPAPLRSPQQARPPFPSMQTQKPQLAHDPLPLPSWLRPNGHDAAGSTGSTTLPGPKLPHEIRAAAAASTAGAAGTTFPSVGNGAGLRKSPWS
ncbi:hypothetical protein JCM3774_000719 [Rhodotorula dairenensis]